MFNFLMILILSTGLFAQDLAQDITKDTNDEKINKDDINKTYSKEGNNIGETYDRYLTWTENAEGHKKGELMLRRRTHYIGNTNIKQKEEIYRRLDGTLKEVVFFKDNEICVRESFYASNFTFKGRREVLKSRDFYYKDCVCIETYKGSKNVQLRGFYGANCAAPQALVLNSKKNSCPSIQECSFVAK
jgi:hypothetical protein